MNCGIKTSPIIPFFSCVHLSIAFDVYLSNGSLIFFLKSIKRVVYCFSE